MTEIQSNIVEVTVFPDRARITRRGTLALEAGVHQIEFDNLPLSLVPESVRAAGRGTVVAALLGVDIKRRFYAETPAANARELEKQIEILNDLDKELVNQVSIAEVQVGFTKKLADQSAEQLARGLALGRAQIHQGSELVAFVQTQLDQAQAALRDLAVKRRENAKQLSKLNSELEALKSARPRERYTATVEIEVKQAGELTLDLTYMLANAAWQALYDVRATGVESDAPGIALSYLAQITQNTGEDWNDVTLTLSTARPTLAAVRPQLTTWYLDVYMPPVVAAAPMPKRAPRPQAPAAALEETAAFAVPPAAMPVAAMEEPTAQVSSEGASVTFKLSQKCSVPSDGTPHKVGVATIDLKPRLDYITLPKLADFAYRRAKLTNSSDFILLAGQANLFVDGDFIGATPLKLVAPGEEFEMTLGVDDRLYIERKLSMRDVDKKFIGDRRRLRIGYETEVRNLRDNKLNLELRDQIPVGRHEQIKVKLEGADPKPAEQTDLGELTWQLSLTPGEKRFIRFEFSVEHPTGMTVTGMP